MKKETLQFFDLQTNSHDRRKVSVAYSDKTSDTCNLLGVLPHQTEFKRVELLEFAAVVVREFGAAPTNEQLRPIGLEGVQRDARSLRKHVNNNRGEVTFMPDALQDMADVYEAYLACLDEIGRLNAEVKQ